MTVEENSTVFLHPSYLPHYRYLSHIAGRLSFLHDQLSFSLAFIFFILFLLNWAQFCICSVVLISFSIPHPGKSRRQIKLLIYLSCVCAYCGFKAKTDDNSKSHSPRKQLRDNIYTLHYAPGACDAIRKGLQDCFHCECVCKCLQNNREATIK